MSAKPLNSSALPEGSRHEQGRLFAGLTLEADHRALDPHRFGRGFQPARKFTPFRPSAAPRRNAGSGDTSTPSTEPLAAACACPGLRCADI